MNKTSASKHIYAAKRERGVTLLELIMVVVIIGIIVAFGYPNYAKQARKAERTDATSALLAIAAAQEKEYLKNNAYTSDMGLLGGTLSEAKKFKLSVALDAGGFLATARRVGEEADTSDPADPECVVFTIDHLGAKRSGGAPDNSPNCW